MQKSGLLCLMDVAAGMEHLHSMGVLHVSTYSLVLHKVTWMSRQYDINKRPLLTCRHPP